MSQLVLWKQTYRRGWSIPCRYLSKLMKRRSSFSSFFVRGTLNIKTGKQQCLTPYRVHTCFPSKWKVSSTWNFWGPPNISWSLLEGQFQSCEVLCVYSFTSRLSSTPHVFSKILKPLKKHWRHIRAFALLFFLTTDGVLKRILQCAVFLLPDAVKSDLFKAGYFTSEDRSVWFSCQWLDWLGITWESPQETIEIVDRRKQLVPLTVLYYQLRFVLSAWRLASFTGQMISTYSSCFWGHSWRLGTTFGLS